MHRFASDASGDGSLGSEFGQANGGVHADDFIGDVAIHDSAGAIAMIAAVAVEGENVDNDWLAGAEFSGAVMVAIGSNRSAGDDGFGIREIAIQQPMINGSADAFGREG